MLIFIPHLYFKNLKKTPMESKAELRNPMVRLRSPSALKRSRSAESRNKSECSFNFSILLPIVVGLNYNFDTILFHLSIHIALCALYHSIVFLRPFSKSVLALNPNSFSAFVVSRHLLGCPSGLLLSQIIFPL